MKDKEKKSKKYFHQLNQFQIINKNKKVEKYV